MLSMGSRGGGGGVVEVVYLVGTGGWLRTEEDAAGLASDMHLRHRYQIPQIPTEDQSSVAQGCFVSSSMQAVYSVCIPLALQILCFPRWLSPTSATLQ